MKRGCSILFALLLAVACHAGDPLDTWHWRNPVPADVPLFGVCYGNGLFVAVGTAGTVLVSPDGSNWAARESGTLAKLRDVTFGGGLFVAVGDDGAILTSTDTRTWARQTTSALADLYSVTYGNGLFVAVGDATFILSSPDGTHWTQRASGTLPLLDVAYGNGLFVAVGGKRGTSYPLPNTPAEHLLLTSTNGIAWEAKDIAVSGFCSAVAFGGGRFVVSVNWRYSETPGTLVSTDGVHWEDRGGYFPQNYGAGINTITYGDGVFYAFGSDDSRTIVLAFWKSRDGVTWDIVSMGAYSGDGFNLASTVRSAVSVNNRVVALGGSETYGWPAFVATVSGETNYQSHVQSIQQFGYGYGRLVHVGQHFMRLDGNFIAVSSNGAQWANTLVDSNWSFNDVTFGGAEYVGVGADGKFATSTNALNWTLRETGDTNALKSVAWGSGQFVTVGDSGTILTSTNARLWSRVPLSNSNNLDQVVFANGLFACLDTSDGSVLTSTNGVDWIPQVQTNFTSIGRLRPAGAFIIGIANDGRVAVSTNGLSWRLVYSSPTGYSYYTEVGYGSGTFLIAGQGYSYSDSFLVVQTSTDTTNWTQRTVRATRTGVPNVAFGNGTFVLSGYNSTILQSDPLTNTAPALAAAPATVFPLPGSEVTLSVLATGSSPLTYQWLRDGTPLAGSDEPFLYLTNPPTAFTNQYSVVVSNAFGAVTSAPVSVVVGVPASLGLGKDAAAQLTITGTPGRHYRVECADSISPSATWTVLTNLTLNSSQETITDGAVETSAKRFYRAVLVP